MTEGTIGTTNPVANASAACARLATAAPELVGGRGWAAAAPIALDVMGGIAEYTGSLALIAAADPQVSAYCGPREDQALQIQCVSSSRIPNNARNPHSHTLPLATFYEADGRLVSAGELRRRIADIKDSAMLAVVSVLYALLAERVAPHLGGGLTLVIESDLPCDHSAERIPAIQTAAAAAAVAVLSLEQDRKQISRVCRRANSLLMGRPCGPATHAGSLLGVPGAVLQICCASEKQTGVFDLPEGAALVGIDCGRRHRQADAKYMNTRIATLMGREIIRSIVHNSNGQPDHANDSNGPGVSKSGLSVRGDWDGSLALLTITDYVDTFRNQLPTKVKGSLFLDRFGPLPDECAAIDPDGVYKVRSRAEHHIYENERVRQFAERMTRATRTPGAEYLVEAGELMYASHWSYGQRCGLGSIESDALVNHLRAEGLAQGIYGARVSGPGAGGTVVVLTSDSAAARDAVSRAVRAYESTTGCQTTLLPMAPSGRLGFAVEPIRPGPSA